MTEALADEDGFEREGDGYRLTTATFDAWIHPDDERWRVVVRAPTIDAAVAGETVAPVVADGWYDTFERRVTDVSGVTAAAVTGPTVRREGDEVVVEASLSPDGDAAEEAVALVNFVEGTWLQGVVPGYDYVEEIEAVRSAARRRGDA